MRFAEIHNKKLDEAFPLLVPAIGFLFKAGMAAWTIYEVYKLYKEVTSLFRAYKSGYIELDEVASKFGKAAAIAMAEFVAVILGVKLIKEGGKLIIKGVQKTNVDLSFNQFKRAWLEYKQKTAQAA